MLLPGGDAVLPGGGAVLPGGGSWLRIGLAASALLTMILLWIPGQAGGQVTLQFAVMAIVWTWLVFRPGSSAAAVLLVGALFLRAAVGHPELDGSLVALVVMLPLVHQLAALCAVVPLRSDVYVSALTPTAARYLGAVLRHRHRAGHQSPAGLVVSGLSEVGGGGGRGAPRRRPIRSRRSTR